MAYVQLDLFVDVCALPWQGRSPRDLTRCAQSFIFKAQAAKGRPPPRDPAQLEIFPRADNAPWIYQGAPLLKEV